MGDWSNGYDGGLQNRRLGFDSLVPRLIGAVIFDLDGVLLDSEAAWRDAKRDIVGEWGGVWKDEASRAMLGMSAPEWSVYMRDELQVDRDPGEIDAEVVRRLLEGYRERLPLLPGAREAVEHVRQSSPAWWLHTDLDVLAQDIFTAGRVPDDEDEPGGLDWQQLTELTRAAFECGGCAGWSIAIYDPEQDPDGTEARRIVQYVTDVVH